MEGETWSVGRPPPRRRAYGRKGIQGWCGMAWGPGGLMGLGPEARAKLE